MLEANKNEFDSILTECGFDCGTISKITYQHFIKYLERAKKLNGLNETRFLIGLRISIGIDIRYIKDIHEGFKELGIIEINNGCIEFIGLHKENNEKKKKGKIDKEEKTQLQKDIEKHEEFKKEKEKVD
jgi:hypothetical protein